MLDESPNAGGSTRKCPPVRRRDDERIPDRLPRVGERPAGADKGVDLAIPVLILVGDLGFRYDRGRGVVALGALLSETLLVLANLVRMNEAGLMKESLDGKKLLLSAPLDRLEKMRGSMFSESSVSTISDAFRFTGDEVEIAARSFSKVQHDLFSLF